jgi:hypothetical protein
MAAASSGMRARLLPRSGRATLDGAYPNSRPFVAPILRKVADWDDLQRRAQERYDDGAARIPDEPDARQKQLTRMGNAAGAAGLSALMAGRDGREWFARAAERYRESWEHAPPGSWGRPIGAMKARILAGDWDAAAGEAAWALSAGAVDAPSPIGRYAAALAYLVLGRDDEARAHADALRTDADFPAAVGDALVFIAAGTDADGYVEAIEAVLASFEERDEYLEDVPVADTVLVLQALAERRGLSAELSSPLLPS